MAKIDSPYCMLRLWNVTMMPLKEVTTSADDCVTEEAPSSDKDELWS